MLRHRDRSFLVPASQTDRLIRVGVGTTPCCAGEKIRFASPAARRRDSSFLPTQAGASSDWKKSRGEAIDGDPLYKLRRFGCAQEDGEGMCVETPASWSNIQRIPYLFYHHRGVVK